MNDTCLNQNRLIGDAEIDDFVLKSFKEGLQSNIYMALQLPIDQVLLHKDQNEVLDFLNSKPEPQSWFSSEKLLRGQKFFEKYAMEIMNLLGLLALPYCYAASPGNKALYLSDKMRQSPGKRLMDTATFIIGVCSAGTLTSSNIGYVHINKTRLIHALVRYHVSKDWNNDWGVPVNQEDLVGTNLAFSHIILEGLERSGFSLSTKEKEAFLFLWKYIGFHLGISTELLPTTIKEASKLNYLIKKRNFKKTIESTTLTNELVAYYETVAPPNQAKLVKAQMRYYLGTEVSEYLGLKPSFLKDQLSTTVGLLKTFENSVSIHKSSYATMLSNQRLFSSQANEKHSKAKSLPLKS